jgi:hypothetical protein
VKTLLRNLSLLAACVLPAMAAAQVQPRALPYNPPAARKVVLQKPVAAMPAHPAVVRIIVAEKDGQSLGSGTLVDVKDPYALVVTNWHVIREAAGEITVVFPDGFRTAARVVKHDADWDLAALSIWKPNVPPVRIATEPPKPGDLLTIAGYGSDGTFRAVGGSCTQYLSPSEKHPHEIVELAAVARQGDSGGPIFNQRGDLAGVLFGSVDNTTSGSYGPRVLQFLEPLLKADAKPTAPPGTAPATPVASPADPSELSTSAAALAIDNQLKSMNPTSPIETAGPLAAISPEEPDLQTEKFSIEHTPLEPFAGFTSASGETSPSEYPDFVQELIGRSPIEQAKSALSIVGLLALIVVVFRFGRSEQKAEE